jgi:hypothetical protein
MAVTAAVSVMAFSAVLAESFAAVAASSLVPSTFVTLTRLAKAGAVSTENASLIKKLPGGTELAASLREAATSMTDMDVLVPKTARITADFEFQASEQYSADASLGVAVDVVTVSAGYSALYTSTSTSKIHLEVDFVSVNYAL